MIYHAAVFNLPNGDAVYRQGVTRDWCANQYMIMGEDSPLRKPDYIIRIRTGHDRKRCNQLHHVMSVGPVATTMSVLEAHAPHHVELVKRRRPDARFKLSLQQRVISILYNTGGGQTPAEICARLKDVATRTQLERHHLTPQAVNAAISGMSTRARVRKWVTDGKDEPLGSWKTRKWHLTEMGKQEALKIKLAKCTDR